MPDGGRRRTPGLRREELAIVAGISVDYLVRLEQNRDRRPSASVLAALCRALRLDDDERAHVLRLAALAEPCGLWPTVTPAEPPSATTLALLDQLDTTPALVLERSADIAASNEAYDALMGATGLFDLQPPNLARFVFLDPRARVLYRDWPTTARELVSGLQAAAASCARDASLEDVVGELLSKSREFARLWARHDVSVARQGVSRLHHPHVGPLDFDREVLILPSGSERRFVTYVPADQQTADALERLRSDDRSAGTGLGRQAV